VFSPYYAWARSRDPDHRADPAHYCALNVALYGSGGKRWAMTERGRRSLRRSAGALEIGRSALEWDGQALTVRIDEITAPLPSRILGTVRLHPAAVTGHVFALDDDRLHRWTPIAPVARVEVALERPASRWTGDGYFDSNGGDAPLEDAFRRWDWSRARLRGGDTAVLYDVSRRQGVDLGLALRFDTSGAVEPFDPPPAVALPNTGWRVARGTRTEAGATATVLQTLEDAPFYARSLVAGQLLGEPVHAVHESLSLDRFRARWVQVLLPFRMPRRGR
jgi:carotenoid 1,2-hydratase